MEHGRGTKLAGLMKHVHFENIGHHKCGRKDCGAIESVVQLGFGEKSGMDSRKTGDVVEGWKTLLP